MRKGERKGSGNQSVVIKKEVVVEGESHGGAWKVAYADFVTAMMAFFLLMWLLNATTEDQRKGLADYFSPNSQLSHASSGTGDPFGGHTAFDQGALVSDRGAVQALVGTRPVPLTPSDADEQPDGPMRGGDDTDQDRGGQPGSSPTPSAPGSPAPSAPDPSASAPSAPAPSGPSALTAAPVPNAGTALPPPAGSGATAPQTGGALPGEAALQRSAPASAGPGSQPRSPTDAELRAAQARQERTEFARAAQQIRDAVRDDPALTELARQLVIDITPDGLRIQILDEERQSMFPLGSAVPNDRARQLLQKVTPILDRLPQEISIAGHTDAAPFSGPDRTNWELSTERANATRRLLVEGGLPDSRIRSVTGNADRDPLVPGDPLAAANRRIAIVVLRAARPAGGAADAGPTPATVAAPGR